ncbi:uncharacterized protein LOC135306315 isoform X2 [Passer domesticus]|uniref:uncharacterized protein LOC135306315 isoform X2 n=1 Tax=Passer domesticus TaxID=48849 RepID=UPI0030FEA224
MEMQRSLTIMHSLWAPCDLHNTGMQELEHKLCLPAGSQLFSSPSRKKATCIRKGCARLVSLWTEGPAMGQGSVYTKHRRHVGPGNTRQAACRAGILAFQQGCPLWLALSSLQYVIPHRHCWRCGGHRLWPGSLTQQGWRLPRGSTSVMKTFSGAVVRRNSSRTQAKASLCARLLSSLAPESAFPQERAVEPAHAPAPLPTAAGAAVPSGVPWQTHGSRTTDFIYTLETVYRNI